MLAFITFRFWDALDILIVAVLIYYLYNIVKGTVAIRIFFGIISIYIAWKIVDAAKMELLSEILGQFISVGVIALLIVFQQELRQFLLLIGNTNIFRDSSIAKRFFNLKIGSEISQQKEIQQVVKACKQFSATKTGALIVFQRNFALQAIITNTIELNSNLSVDLLESIFNKNSPLHDGAAVIHHGKLTHVKGVLPISRIVKLGQQYGLRHRAALGLTEKCDAVVVIVSEQTGAISIALEGRLLADLSPNELDSKLHELL